MTARTDLDNAFSILDAGILSHVTALKSARDTAAAAQAIANDDTYLQGLTVKVLAYADTLAASNPPVLVEAPPAPVVATPPALPVTDTTTVLPPAQLDPADPLNGVAPVAVSEPPKPQTLMEMMASVAKGL